MPRKISYPYDIVPIQADPIKSIHRLPSIVNQFFLAEALLRSREIMRAYRVSNRKYRSVLAKHGIPFDPLSKIHHELLLTDTAPSPSDKEPDAEFKKIGFVADDILDLAIAIKLGPSAILGKGGEVAILEQLRNPPPHLTFLRLDITKSWNAIKQQLEPLFRTRNTQFRAALRDRSLPQIYPHYIKTPFEDIKAWLRYLQCYDLRIRDGLEYGDIAKRVYHKSGPLPRDQAKKAVVRVTLAIRAAEQDTWPPECPSR